MIRRFLPFLLSVACACLSPALALGQWTAISLEASPAFRNSRVWAVSGSQQGGEGVFGTGIVRPLLWNGTASSWVDLSPVPSNGGRILGMIPGEQVGQFGAGAALWHGTAQSWVGLHPAGMFSSAARATDGAEQAGDVTVTGAGLPRAALWHGTAQSYVDLQPPGFIQSSASAVWQGWQAGGVSFQGFINHAALWHGTAASFVDLHPPDPDVKTSGLTSMAAGQQAGVISRWSNPNHHAAIWSGTAASCTDINPPQAALSILNATCGVAQAGYANVAGVNGAAVWFGTPESFVNLGALLDPEAYYESVATSVAVSGNTVYVGGYAARVADSQHEAYLWVGTIPSPSGLASIAAAGLIAARRRRA